MSQPTLCVVATPRCRNPLATRVFATPRCLPVALRLCVAKRGCRATPRVIPASAFWRPHCHSPGRAATTHVVATPFPRCALRTHASSAFCCVLQFATMRCEPALRACVLNAAYFQDVLENKHKYTKTTGNNTSFRRPQHSQKGAPPVAAAQAAALPPAPRKGLADSPHPLRRSRPLRTHGGPAPRMNEIAVPRRGDPKKGDAHPVAAHVM